MEILEIVAKHPFWFAVGAMTMIFFLVLSRAVYFALIGNAVAYGIETDSDYFKPPVVPAYSIASPESEGGTPMQYWTEKRRWRPALFTGWKEPRVLSVLTTKGPRTVRLRSGGRNVRALEF